LLAFLREMNCRQEGGKRMIREELTERIQDFKRESGMSWKEIAEHIGGGSPIRITAALLGQMRLTPEQAAKAGSLMNLSDSETRMLTETPYRGSVQTVPPTDPVIYRFYELVMVYGTTLKALIDEEFGDGIMSAIDLDLSLERQPDPKGDRVKVTMCGKFLPYKYS
jgi:cyanate lyase